MSNASKYDTDFHAWANEQASLLRAGRLSEADIENIAEEIESMGRGEKRELASRMAVLLAHLLKWQFQPGLRGNSWRLTIKEQRRQLAKHLGENPSLGAQALLDDAIADAYETALAEVQKETGFPEHTFPATCPYVPADIFNAGFMPE